MSAGNHAQAVAYHAAALGIAATIVMPVTTPFVKVAATKAYGAQVLLDGETISEAQARAEAEARERGLIWVHPYDDPHVIAGQGTVGLEMLEEVPDLDALVIPIGGGGLISGVATAAKAIKPGIEIVGVEAALYPSFWNVHPRRAASVRRRHACRRHRGEERRHTDAADRAGSRQRHRAGRRGAHRARLLVNAFLTLQKAMAEGDRRRGPRHGDAGRAPSGSPASASVWCCAAAISIRASSASVMVRELERDNRIVSFRLTIADRPGLLGQIATMLGRLGTNILEVDHRRLFLDVPAKGARLDVTVETRDAAHADEILSAFKTEGFSPVRIATGDAME